MSDNVLDKKQKRIIQKNKLIEARYRLTLQEKRLVLWLMSKIKSEDVDFKTYQIEIKDFASMMGLHVKTQYKEMHEITAKLLTRLIQIEDEETGKLKQMAWLAFAEWDPNGAGICSMQFHPELKPYLLQLKEQFTQIGFADLLGLSSSYSVRLLEILAQYETIGMRTTTIDDIRAWCGIEKDEYQKYNHLKSRVIDRAKNEINEKTNYNVDYEEVKKSKKVNKINWTISKKNNTNPASAKFAQVETPRIKKISNDTSSHKIKEIAEFCKAYEDEINGVNYLTNVSNMEITNNRLKLTFSSPFFKSQCDNNILLQDRLAKFFKVKHIELV